MLTTQQAFEALNTRNSTYYDLFGAWYSGDERKLRKTSKPGMFWNGAKNRARKVHVPIAAEIASASADLMFAEPISIFTQNKKDQERLDGILAFNDFNAKLYAAAETCSAFGDVYLKINWEQDIAGLPLINVVQALNALPEYKNDVLQYIHFFTSYETVNSKYVWVYERYENGLIHTEVYEGTESQPNQRLRDGSPEDINTGIDMILAAHIKNLTPNYHTRNLTVGRSDLDGLVSMMDALDEAYSSWVRDLNLGKARLIVPRDYFHTERNPLQPGEWTTHFDKEDEIYVAMDVDIDKSNNGGFVEAQFDIRSQQHKETCDALREAIISAAGYSPQTFGLQIQGRAESGTALNAREKKSYTTKARKELYWLRPLERFISALLEIDKYVFKWPYSSAKISVEFKEPAQDINNIAQAVEMLSRAGKISTYEAVKRINPDWSDEQINEEVQKIYEEHGISLIEDQNSLPADLDTDVDPDSHSDNEGDSQIV